MPWPTKYEIEVNGKTADQSFDGTITARLRGDYEFIFRALFLQIPGDKLDEFFKSALAAQAKSGSGTMALTGVKVSDPLGTREPLQIDGILKFDDSGEKHEDGSTYEFGRFAAVDAARSAGEWTWPGISDRAESGRWR